MSISMIGPKFYGWDKDGKPLAYGKVYTYLTGTTTPKITYKGEGGSVANDNPVILNGEGYADIYLDGAYSIVLKDADDVEIWSSDPVSSNTNVEWTNCLAATYVSSTSLKVTGNVTAEYDELRSVRVDNDTASYAYSRVVSSSYAAGETTIVLNDPIVAAGVLSICSSIISSKSFPDSAFFEDNSFVKYADPTMSISDIKALFTENSVIYFEAGTYAADVSQSPTLFEVLSNTKIFMAPGCVISISPSGLESYQFFNVRGRENIEITGGKLIGDRETNTITTGEFGHGIDVRNCKNVLIHNVEITQMWGDGIYLGGTVGGINNTNVMIQNNTIEFCRRQGISVVAGVDMDISGNRIRDIAGTAPAAGIDIEPNPAVGGEAEFQTTDIHIHDNFIDNTSGTSILVTGPQGNETRIYIQNNILSRGSRFINCSTTYEDIGLVHIEGNIMRESDFAMGDFSNVKNLVMRSNTIIDNTTGGSGAIFGWTVKDAETVSMIGDTYVDNVFHVDYFAVRVDSNVVFFEFDGHFENSRGILLNSTTIGNYNISGVFNTKGWNPIVVLSTITNIGTISGDFSGYTGKAIVVDENGVISDNINLVNYVDIDEGFVNSIGGKSWGSQFTDNVRPYAQYSPTIEKLVTYLTGAITDISPDGYGTATDLTLGSATGLAPVAGNVRGLRFSGLEYYTLNYGTNPRLFNNSSMFLIVFKSDAYVADECIFDGRYVEGAFLNGVRLMHTGVNTLTLVYGSDSDLTQIFTIPDGEIAAMSFLIEDDSRMLVSGSNPYDREFSELLRNGNDTDNPAKNVTIGALDAGTSPYNGVIYDISLFEYNNTAFNERYYQRITDSYRRFYVAQEL